MAEPAAWTAGVEGERGRRPGFFRVFFVTVFFCGTAALAAALFGLVVTLVGVTYPPVWVREVPYLPTGGGPIAADALAVLYVTSFAVPITRWTLSGWVDEPPAWTWVAVTLVAAAALGAVSPGVAVEGGWALAGIALRYVAWDRDGHARPDPLRPGRGLRIALMCTPAALLAGLTAYASFHPLTLGSNGALPIARGTSAVIVPAPGIHNDGSRPVRILSIEPGRERGYALHLIGTRTFFDGARPISAPATHPFSPVVIPPHGDAVGLALQLSRAGCRRGTSGRIETVRVRYELGGEHVMELALDPALTLNC